jgi:predicted  nucleic acid-binding Zn-ribbon protein
MNCQEAYMSVRRLIIPVAAVSLLSILAVHIRAASPQPPSSDMTTALLAEVHALRLAMEQSATIAPRVQLTLARLNIEEQRTLRLSTQLDQIRQEQATAALDTKKLADELNDLQKALQTVSDESTRRQYQFEATDVKRRQVQQASIEDRLRARENEAAQLLGAEQSRWIDLNAKLDELERLLGPVR